MEQSLRQHHIGLTKAALVNALRDADSAVRYLAAEKLAEDNAQDAVPAIKQALAVERVAGSRINIAFALAQLGDEAGATALKTGCADASLPGYLRARAASYLLDLRRDSCLTAVLDMLQSEGDADSRLQALSLLPRFQHISKEDFQKAFNLIVNALADPTPAVRMNASIALGTLQDASAIPYLQTAIANERDDVVRSTMQSVLQRLQETKAN